MLPRLTPIGELETLLTWIQGVDCEPTRQSEFVVELGTSAGHYSIIKQSFHQYSYSANDLCTRPANLTVNFDFDFVRFFSFVFHTLVYIDSTIL
jgi:hypothetical protein